MVGVRVEPLGIELDVADGETLIEAAWRAGYYWPTVCGGLGQCKTCYVRVLEGEDQLVPPDAFERDNLELLIPTVPRPVPGQTVRLACQLQVKGRVVVSRPGVRAQEGSA